MFQNFHIQIVIVQLLRQKQDCLVPKRETIKAMMKLLPKPNEQLYLDRLLTNSRIGIGETVGNMWKYLIVDLNITNSNFEW